jgi:diguanylate cyclase (GGDEF)-like protein
MDEAVTRAERVSDAESLRTRSGELANELRAAAIRGDRVHLTRLLSRLLGSREPGSGRSVALLALTHLIDSLRSTAMTDELTGVLNRRGFIEVGTRFLNVARRDLHPAYLIYFDLNELKHVNDTAGHAAGDALIRQMGTFLRELFPSYGVYEVLGRLGGDEFAALTTDMQCPSRSEILLRARMPHARAADLPELSLSLGFAYFNPLLPTTIDDLLQSAEQAMYEHKRMPRGSPSGLGPYHARRHASPRGANPGTEAPHRAAPH